MSRALAWAAGGTGFTFDDDLKGAMVSFLERRSAPTSEGLDGTGQMIARVGLGVR